MKKLPTTLGAVLICSTSAASVVSCGAKDDGITQIDVLKEEQSITKTLFGIEFNLLHYANNGFDKIGNASQDSKEEDGIQIKQNEFNDFDYTLKTALINLAKTFNIQPGKDVTGLAVDGLAYDFSFLQGDFSLLNANFDKKTKHIKYDFTVKMLGNDTKVVLKNIDFDASSIDDEHMLFLDFLSKNMADANTNNYDWSNSYLMFNDKLKTNYNDAKIGGLIDKFNTANPESRQLKLEDGSTEAHYSIKYADSDYQKFMD